MHAEVCGEQVTHESELRVAREYALSAETLCSLSELFGVLGDVTRIKILVALGKVELCVCDLAELTGVTPSGVSHQLRLLRAARLVRYRREGKQVIYRLSDAHVTGLVEEGLEHVLENAGGRVPE